MAGSGAGRPGPLQEDKILRLKHEQARNRLCIFFYSCSTAFGHDVSSSPSRSNTTNPPWFYHLTQIVPLATDKMFFEKFSKNSACTFKTHSSSEEPKVWIALSFTFLYVSELHNLHQSVLVTQKITPENGVIFSIKVDSFIMNHQNWSSVAHKLWKQKPTAMENKHYMANSKW